MRTRRTPASRPSATHSGVRLALAGRGFRTLAVTGTVVPEHGGRSARVVTLGPPPVGSTDAAKRERRNAPAEGCAMSKSDAEPKSPAPRFVGEGFHVEPDFRVEPDYRTESGASVNDPNTGPATGSGFGASGASESAESSAGLPGRTTALALPSASSSEGGPSAAELNNAFDDPQHGEPGRDRLAVHAIWEIVLLVAAVVMGFVLNQKSHLGNPDIRGLLVLASVYGVVAMAAGLSLRAGAVNLAVGPIMVGSGLYFAQQHAHHNFWTSAGLAVLAAAGIGAGIAVVVTILHVPGWAASLAAFVCVDVWITHLPAKVTVSGGPNVLRNGYYVFAVVAVVGILCALAGSSR